SASRRGRPACRQKLGRAGSLSHARISDTDSPNLTRNDLQFLAFLEIAGCHQNVRLRLRLARTLFPLRSAPLVNTTGLRSLLPAHRPQPWTILQLPVASSKKSVPEADPRLRLRSRGPRIPPATKSIRSRPEQG